MSHFMTNQDTPPPFPPAVARALEGRTILVLGAGWLGWPFALRCAEAGAQVTTVRRSSHTPVPGGRAAVWDVTGPVPPDAPRADAVVLCVAPTRARGDDHRSTYPPAARHAAALAAAAGARALVYTSSTGVYGYHDGRLVREETPAAAPGPRADALRDAESIIRAAASATLCAGVLRVSGLYGPGRDPSDRYRDAARLAGRAGDYANFAWRDDVGDAIGCWLQHALSDGACPPDTLNVSDGAPLTIAECAWVVAQADGRAAPDIPETAAPDATPHRSNQRIDVTRLVALGWTPRMPHLRAGLAALGAGSADRRRAPYGPQTMAIRRALQQLAGLDDATRADVARRWRTQRDLPASRRADTALGAAITGSGREAERDAASAPLLQLLRVGAPAGGDPSPETSEDFAEASLALVMALIVRDVLTDADFRSLTRVFDDVITDVISIGDR